MSEQWDRYNLAARLEKFGDELMTLCENHAAIENRIDVCNQISAVCRITMTLKALRAEARRADPDAGVAGSAVRKYASEFAAGHQPVPEAPARPQTSPSLTIPAGPILPRSDLQRDFEFTRPAVLPGPSHPRVKFLHQFVAQY